RYPAFVWVKTARWQRWEIDCFNLLHGGGNGQYGAFADGTRAVATDILPGVSLAEHFVRRTITPEMLDAAGRELRRAHELRCEFFNGPWSHGDANLANVLFAATEIRARLIDFELVHHPAHPAGQ